MTPDRLIPEYLKKKNEQMEAEESKREVTAAQRRADELLILNLGPKFWKHLTEKLHLAVDSFPALPALKLRGELRSLALTQVHIEIHRIGGPRLSGTHTDLYCGGKSINCTTLGDGVYSLEFCILSETEIGVVSSQKPGTAMDVEHASEYIIDRMIAFVERQAG